MPFKQIPVNAGYFVCIAATANALLAVDLSGNPTIVGQATPAIADQYIDLGVTRRTGGKVYRKVVKVAVPLGANPTEQFIEIGGTTSAFARMG